MLGILTKQPVDQLDYDLDFTEWLDDGDTITSAVAIVDPVDGTLVIDSINIASPVVKVWLSGGDNGKSYKIEVTATTTGGRIKEECFKIRVKDC